VSVIAVVAQNEENQTASQPELLYLDLYINHQKFDGIYRVVSANDKIWFDKNEQDKLRLNNSINLLEKQFFKAKFVRLPQEIKANIRWQDLSIWLEIPPELMALTVIEDEPPTYQRSDAGYAFYWNHHISFYHETVARTVALETAHQPVIATPYGSLSNQFVTRTGAYNEIVRLESSYTLDLPHLDLRLIGGDSASDAPNWSSHVPILGLKVQKNFLFQTGLLTHPTMSFSGALSKYSDAEIWINDSIRFKKDLPMGRFLLDNINLPTGAHEGRLVMRDQSGIASSIPFSYYTDPELLRPGLVAYSYSLGSIRRGYGSKSFSYGGPAFIGSHKFGLKNFWTLGFHAQAAWGHVLFGTEQRFGLFNFGSTAIAAVLNVTDQKPGYSLSAELNLKKFDIFWSTRGRFSSTHFTPLSPTEEKTLDPSLIVSSALRLDKPYLRHSALNYLLMLGNNVYQHSIGIKQGVPLGQFLSLNLSGNYNFSTSDFNVFAFLSYSMAPRHSLAVRTLGNERGFQTSAGYSMSPDHRRENRVSCAAFAGLDEQVFGQGNIGFDNKYVHTRVDAFGNRNSFSYYSQLGGAFGVMKNHWFYSRPIKSGLTLVHFPSQNGVGIFRDNNVLLGKTDKNGFLLLTDLQPYEPVKLGVDVKDLDLFVAAEQVERDTVLTPGYQTAHELKFVAKEMRYILFRVIQDGKLLPVGSKIEVNFGETSAFVTRNGSVFLDVPANVLIIRGVSQAASCRFTIELPPKTKGVIEELPDVYCQS
jgi:outer membrane usher protein